MREVYLVGAARTAIGKLMGTLAGVRAPTLGATAMRAALSRSKVAPDAVDEVILGCVIAAGLGQNPARQAQIEAGIPSQVGALTINKVCGSGLKAVSLAAQAIRAGDANIVVAGGMESMSQAPYVLPGMRRGFRLGHAQLLDANVRDGLWDHYNDYHMGMTAELVVEKYRLSREEQDAYAVRSHHKAAAAQAAGRFDDEICPIEVPQRKGDPITFTADESVRASTSLEKLARLKPVFKRDGSVTAGNAPGLNDGGAAVVVASGDAVREHGLEPLARITGYATGHTDPEWAMLAPIDGVRNLVKRTGLDSPSAFDLVELNEAFSAAALAVTQELELDPEKVNVNGGAVALGHPIGASGARILVTLVHALRARNLKTGLAALCLGGGGSVALSIEAV